ncbi:MAG TPA: hypothetical protein PLF13_13965 [candidate division Zixibacteria bacterium]|nr:hypothetical protein [candidate division Zixibacteria bacterium]
MTPSNQSDYRFREAVTPDQLEAVMRLRYRVYQNSRLARFIPANPHGFDLDCYDLHARHFGLYCGEDVEPVGYLRVVEEVDPGPVGHVLDLGRRVPELGRRLKETTPQPLPLMAYTPNVEVIERLLQEKRDRGEKVVEACRMAIDPDHRSLAAARHIFESSMSIYFFARGYHHMFACCDSSKKAFYRRYAVTPLAGIPEEDFAGIGVSSSCLIGSASDVPTARRRRLESFARQWLAMGEVRAEEVLGSTPTKVTNDIASLPLAMA